MEDFNNTRDDTRVYYFIWDDWTYIEPESPHQFFLSNSNILEKDEKGVLITTFNKHYIREIGYLPLPEKRVAVTPRYDPFCNSLYDPGPHDDDE